MQGVYYRRLFCSEEDMASTVVPPYPLIQDPRFTAARKNLKIKEINGSQVSKRASSENGP
jgi:hypothetical protein